MNKPLETPPPVGSSTAPPDRTGRTILIVAIAALILFCCLCLLVAVIGAAAFFMVTPSGAREGRSRQPGPRIEITRVVESTPESEKEIRPQVELPTATPRSPSGGSGEGLGVSRQEMIRFFEGHAEFEFGDPVGANDAEQVEGESSSICIASDCALATLGGPNEELTMVSVVVPASPEDSDQTVAGFHLLMASASYFMEGQTGSNRPTRMLMELIEAYNDSRDLETSFENNGLLFLVTYSQADQKASLEITPAR